MLASITDGVGFVWKWQGQGWLKTAKSDLGWELGTHVFTFVYILKWLDYACGTVHLGMCLTSC